MNRKLLLGIFALSIIGILGVSYVSAYGFGEMRNPIFSEEEKAEIQEQHEAIQNAIENSDYASWKTLMQQKIALMQEQITQENFDALVQRHEERAKIREARGEFFKGNNCPNFEDGQQFHQRRMQLQ